MSCKAAKFDPDEGRYYCDVSGDQCMYYIPNSKKCAEEYGEGPDANSMDDRDKQIAFLALLLRDVVTFGFDIIELEDIEALDAIVNHLPEVTREDFRC